MLPSSVPTLGATVALPPTLDVANGAPPAYNPKVRNRIEGYAIVGSVVGVILFVSLVIHFVLKMKRVDSSSFEWKFKHLTLAELEEENMILEIEASSSFNLSPPIHIQDEEHEEEEKRSKREQEENRRNPAEVEDQKGVVVGTQVDTL